MRQHIRDFVEKCEEYWDLPEPIYEFGSMAEGQEPERVDMRSLFPGKEYIRSDFREGPNVDVILDLHDIDLPDETAGAAICVETLEHVKYPWVAMKEIHRILKPDGIAIITSTMHFRIHNHPADYWRFTPDGFKTLLETFEQSWVDLAGDPTFPHTVAGIGWKGGNQPDNLDDFAVDCDDHWILRKLEHGSAT